MSDTDYRYCPLCRAELATVERGGAPRLACADCGFVHWRNPVPVVAAVVERAGRVVLVHSVGRPPTWYGLVAGFLERGEHPEAAVLREVAEELGLEGRLDRAIGVYPFERLNQVIFAYHVVVPSHEPIVLAADELDDYKEVPLEKLKPWRQGTGPALRDWLVARGYDPPVVDFGKPLEP
jgi:NADH pyrophosphatase NudC (nudix superfamily)